MKQLNVLDLFSGIGGFSLGLERTGGYKTVAFCEIDEHCHKVLKKHWPTTPIFTDVSKLKWNLSESVDVICGGFPCQDISVAGKQKGIKEGTRSGLWKEYLRLINEIKPRYAIIENVERLRKNGLGLVLSDLASIGYDAEWNCITADSIGLPHQRDRLFIISYPGIKRQHGSIGKERQLQTHKKRPDSQAHAKREECKSKPVQVCPILSRGHIDNYRNSNADRAAFVSRVRRVTNGVPERMDERLRKQRIKQLGNSIVPGIAEIIGKAILEWESK